jgi:hypothetical protein
MQQNTPYRTGWLGMFAGAWKREWISIPLRNSCFRTSFKCALECLALASVLVTLLMPSAAQDKSAIQFVNRQKASGIQFVLDNSPTEDKPVIDSVLGGVALLDYDNDGYLDIFLTNGATIPGLIKDGPRYYNRLYHNNHDGTFTDVTDHAGVRGEGYSMGAAAADYDNDGRTDLYVTGVNRNFLYHNNGDGTFTDVTEHAGVTAITAAGKKMWSVSAAWVDYDNDGRLDLFVDSYLDWTPENNKVCGPPGKRLSCHPNLYDGQASFLYHNNGDGTFTDVSAKMGISEHIGKGMGIAIADFNGDGWMDIFVANDKVANFLFKNRGGGRGFDEVGVESFVAYNDDGLSISNMGADFRNWNNDGLPGLFVTALRGETFPLLRNEGNGFFTSDDYKAGIGFQSMRMSGWGAGIYDFDNDGFKDLFTANSQVNELPDPEPEQQYKEANAVFHNLRNGTFKDVSGEAGPDMKVLAAHRGAAFGDLNNDGKVDVVVSVIGDHPELLYNISPGHNHWISIQTVGVKSNRDGIGTRIKIVGEAGLVQYNHVTTAGSYASSNDKRVLFGLGNDAAIKEIELRWPSGKVQTLHNVKADQMLKITEE